MGERNEQRPTIEDINDDMDSSSQMPSPASSSSNTRMRRDQRRQQQKEQLLKYSLATKNVIQTNFTVFLILTLALASMALIFFASGSKLWGFMFLVSTLITTSLLIVYRPMVTMSTVI